MSRIKIFTGHFGSGKTEMSINYALKLRSEGKKVALVDIDIVNPYFCSRDITKFLESKGIRVISANPDLSNVELMVVPAEVNSVFNDKSYDVVFDIGGDDQGAIVLGRYNEYFTEEEYDMYFVINNNRPFTKTVKECEEYIGFIEKASKLKVNGFISNTNLSFLTEEKHILNGDKIVKELSLKTGIPYVYTMCEEKFANLIKDKVSGEVFVVKRFMQAPWNDHE